MIRLKNILAENMLRFGPKNLSESDRMRLQQRLLSEATLKDLDPTGMASAQKFFAAEFLKNTDGPQFSTAGLIYVAYPTGKELGFGYSISLFKLQSVSFGPISFPVTAYYGDIRYMNNEGTFTDSTNLELGQDLSPAINKQDTVADVAYSINENYYAKVKPESILTHFNGQKAKLATTIASAKASKNFAALGPLLKGSAKTVYDLIAAS
jgi:hypothetical protein